MADVCEPYPIPIICELLGAPPEDWKLFSAWATDIFRIFNNNLVEDLPLIAQAAEELTAYVSDMIAARRADPRDDLLSDLIAIEQEGDRLSTDEMAMLAQAVLMAGTDTTRNQLACSVALFTEHPDQWALLAERPELAARAVEESMRYLGAVRGTARFAAEDVVYRDVLFPQGTLVATSLAGANRDPEAFDDPATFDITRERSTAQMTFGSGIHFCMGAALARAGDCPSGGACPGSRNGEVEWKPSTFGIWGPARLPCASSPRSRCCPGASAESRDSELVPEPSRRRTRPATANRSDLLLFELSTHSLRVGKHRQGPSPRIAPLTTPSWFPVRPARRPSPRHGHGRIRNVRAS